MTTSSMISARGLRKEFTVARAQVTAVHGLDLEVGEGELVAFLGPNGAGKSTSLRMLTTLLPPTAGHATVAGFDIATQAAQVRHAIGYIGQGNSGGHNQRVRDELLSQGAFYGMGRADTVRRADELLDSLDLAELSHRRIAGLSGGQKRRLDIALGLMHAPRLLFLDEPSTGLDPQSRANLWQHILELRRQHGTTVFVTTHYLEEADLFAERVMVMDHGTVIADDTASSLKANLTGDVITLGFSDAEAAGRAARIITDASAAGLPGATADTTRSVASAVTQDGNSIQLTVHRGDRLLPTLLRELDAAGILATSTTLRQPTLDDVFLALTGRSLREGGPASEGPQGPTTSTASTSSTTTEGKVSA